MTHADVFDEPHSTHLGLGCEQPIGLMGQGEPISSSASVTRAFSKVGNAPLAKLPVPESG
jgi:hypothetical protein